MKKNVNIQVEQVSGCPPLSYDRLHLPPATCNHHHHHQRQTIAGASLGACGWYSVGIHIALQHMAHMLLARSSSSLSPVLAGESPWRFSRCSALFWQQTVIDAFRFVRCTPPCLSAPCTHFRSQTHAPIWQVQAYSIYAVLPWPAIIIAISRQPDTVYKSPPARSCYWLFLSLASFLQCLFFSVSLFYIHTTTQLSKTSSLYSILVRFSFNSRSILAQFLLGSSFTE